jgi:hypothetical protein
MGCETAAGCRLLDILTGLIGLAIETTVAAAFFAPSRFLATGKVFRKHSSPLSRLSSALWAATSPERFVT